MERADIRYMERHGREHMKVEARKVTKQEAIRIMASMQNPFVGPMVVYGKWEWRPAPGKPWRLVGNDTLALVHDYARAHFPHERRWDIDA